MKITLFLIFICSFSVSASTTSKNEKISITLENGTLKDVFSAIRAQTNYSFWFDADVVDVSKSVSVNIKSKTVNDVLSKVLQDQGLEFTMSGDHIIINKKGSHNDIAPTSSPQQNKRIVGQIRGSDGLPIIGANIVEKGTTNGSISDMDGRFRLEVNPNAILQISYIGYVLQEVPVREKTTFDIELIEDSQSLDEVVVVGYGIQKKSVVTAAISRVSSEELSNSTPTRIEDVLKGKVSGVQITQNSGQPGASSVVRVRGIGTINNSDPLFIVDGMPVSEGIDFLNPRDIESVEVLKDAASAAIYGARAANGVILVTTKSGNIGKANISYQFSYGIQKPWRQRELLNGGEYEMIMNEARLNAGLEPLFPTSSSISTDWQGLIFNENAPIVNHNASISGGNEKGSYFISFGLIDQEGIAAKGKSDYKRSNFRLNSDYTVFEAKDRNFLKKMRIGANIGYTKIDKRGIDDNSEWDGPLFAATMSPPNSPLYEKDEAVIKELSDKYGDMLVKDSEGKMYKIISGSELANPVAIMQIINQRKASHKLVGSIWGELDIIDNLIFKTSYSTDMTFGEQTDWRPQYYLSETRLDATSRITADMNRRIVWNFENTLRYNKSFGEHNFSAMIGTTIQKTDYSNIQGRNVNLVANMPEKDYLDFALGTKADQETSGGANEHALASFFGRLNYNHAERYLAEFTLRRDGSSNFPTNNKWAYFPSVSLGWNIHNEEFFINDGFINQMKLRASWGKNGNEAIGAFQYTSLITTGANYIFGNDIAYSGMRANRLVNRQVKWEESEQYDLGIDFRFLNNTLSASFDLFKKKTEGMLMRLPIPDFIGNNVPDGNVGSMSNKGIEMELSYRNSHSDFNYEIGLNASYMKNEIEDIGVAAGYMDFSTFGTVGVIQRHTTGYPVAHFFGTPALGIFQTTSEVENYRNKNGELLQPNAQPGDVIFEDTNGDGVINDDDRTYLGKPSPDWTVGLNLSLEYKGIDLTMFWQGAFGGEIFDASRRSDLALVNYSSYILDRWHGEGTSNRYPRVVYANQDSNNNTRVSSINIYNGDYLRLKTLQLGYTLPSSLTRKFFTQNLRLYVMCENLLTFTDYHGGDPEVGATVNSSNTLTGLGVDRGIYPQAKTITFGASITF